MSVLRYVYIIEDSTVLQQTDSTATRHTKHIIYEGKSKIIRTFIFMDYFKNTKHENDLSFFYIISTHFDALVPAVYKLINAI